MKELVVLVVAVSMLMSGCIRDNVAVDPLQDREMQGWKPVYAEAGSLTEIKGEAPRPIQNLGKIYYNDNTIYVVEQLKGIHVIDNTDPTNPIALKFIQVPGSRDIAMKGKYLYTDNASDLVVLDVENLDDIKLINRVPGLYDEIQQAYPETADQGEFFECVDADKGIVVGWEFQTLTNPQCQR